MERTMQFSDKTFAVLDALDREEISNQRQLANDSGVSLGQVNYILNSLRLSSHPQWDPEEIGSGSEVCSLEAGRI